MTIDIELFAGVDDFREYLNAPWRRAGKLYATNGHIMVEIPDDGREAAPFDKHPDCAGLFDKHTPSEFHPFAACLMFKASHSSEVVCANLDALAEAHQAEVEDWRGRLAAQCGETLAAQAEVARLTRENEGLAKALGEIAWSNDSKWQSDRANAALAGASGAQEGERHDDA